ncbi:hypothetical protein A1O3_05782 [Capronia epimyces CBS 606.96]|uniref:Transcription factor domain-containing protein n=1 Tax=Capronia epimyces CBS 606.96 TaxID=1182542 RepID=W9XX10_9EURO|nr:uncharacterized protein A1O3_05782 [Capronia epimyces CBS 606.96]EXJ85107.1 hypothetical protein A1O3_05782 [Capronia epimyces CBS 606.96]
MTAPKFLFINKHPQSDSLSHSNKQERISIHSHVQKGRRYKKADHRIGHDTRLPLLQLQPARRPRGESGGDALVTSDQCPIERTSRDQMPDSSRQPLSPQAAGLRDAISSLGSSSNRSTPQSIPVFPASAEESFDPFDVTCIRVDGAVHSLLQYFLLVQHPGCWHIERASRPDHKYVFQFDAMSVIQGCLHDEYNMYALLASMASFMTYLDEIPPSRDGSYYIHKALKASQEYVHSHQPITGRMIFNVFHLGCAEWYRYNGHAAYVHLKAAKKLVDAMGGLKAMDGPLVDLLLSGDQYVAAELRQKPLWSPTDFESGDSHPMTAHGLCELQKLLSGKVKTAAGLLTSTQQEIVPTGLRWIILDLAVVLSVLRSSQSPDMALGKLPADGIHWVHIRTLAIRHRLLSMDLSDPRSGAIRTAIVLWIFRIFTISGRKRSIKIIAPFLREMLLTIVDHLWDGHEEVRLWILTVGALSASSGSDCHDWFVGELRRCLTSTLDNPDPDTIFDALILLSERFFYLALEEASTLRSLAKDIYHVRLEEKE